MKKEAEIHIEIMDWVRANEEDFEALKCIYHPPNSFFGVSFGIVKWLQKLGMRSGVWDLIVPLDNGVYSALYIEVKSEKGKLSKQQQEWKEIIMKNTSKWPLFVEVKDAQTGIDLISKYLGMTE
jgi:hypothetical protein